MQINNGQYDSTSHYDFTASHYLKQPQWRYFYFLFITFFFYTNSLIRLRMANNNNGDKWPPQHHHLSSTHPTTQTATNTLSDHGNSSSSSCSRSGAAGAGLNRCSRRDSGKFTYISFFSHFTKEFPTDKLCLRDMSYEWWKEPIPTEQRLKMRWNKVSFLYILLFCLFY